MVETLATALSIAAVVASFFWFVHRRIAERREMGLLERYLAAEKSNPRFADDTGKRTVNHLMRELGFSQEKILHLSNKSGKVKRTSRRREDGMSGEVLFEYDEE
ncbi:hypothetical protein [Oricola cellulosilytica]|uniref:Uncharacterized protein n=1 Tax=Oricola cellulosilytica TaxID=1429082 RepID=A0A4R0P692_9HYPH|nr:hypothetical protein [Oricola cellulosilytica]TCD11418.1 hypothetical protein E0D97_17090 [Oricola cellulosilytica]